MTDEMMNFRALVEKAASCVAVIIAVGVNARFWARDRPLGGRDLLDRVLEQAETARPAGREARHAQEGMKAAVAKLMNAPGSAARFIRCATRWPTPARAAAVSSPPSCHRLRPQ
jgi:hypothetical protein